MPRPAPPPRLRPRRLVAAALLVAVLDIAYVIVLYVVVRRVTTVERIFQSIAAGVLGPASFGGGWRTATLGAALHLVIASTWTAAFAVAYGGVAAVRRASGTTRGAVATGLGYGMFVWLAMELVVVPLSRAQAMPPTLPMFWVDLVQQGVCVGLPIVLLTRVRPPDQP